MLAFPTGRADQWLLSMCSTATRYSGGAAPALHRFPYPASASIVSRMLSGLALFGKDGRELLLEPRALGVVTRAIVGRSVAALLEARVEHGDRLE
jgi:hypothetical protein